MKTGKCSAKSCILPLFDTWYVTKYLFTGAWGGGGGEGFVGLCRGLSRPQNTVHFGANRRFITRIEKVVNC